MSDYKIPVSLEEQKREFVRIVFLNPYLKEILNTLEFPDGNPWYLAAGCVNQTIWNFLTGREITYGIKDYDLVYWSANISDQEQEKYRALIGRKYKSLNIEFDIHNEARIHTRYPSLFGISIDQFKSVEAAICSWPSTVTCVGITAKLGRNISLYAPFGLSDIFEMKLKYNPETVCPPKFIPGKLERWKLKWPELKVIESSYPKV
jgi:hypothetical protein